ncbi:MAG: hypothetical protein HRT98_03285 [Mycoplasmatales bacterium]|nr:hypothetical protein [Mycoplasmatales bacterium]
MIKYQTQNNEEKEIDLTIGAPFAGFINDLKEFGIIKTWVVQSSDVEEHPNDQEINILLGEIIEKTSTYVEELEKMKKAFETIPEIEK